MSLRRRSSTSLSAAPCEDMEVEVGPSNSFAEGARALVRAGPRNIAVYLHKGQFYAIDNACYHHGGPLHNGDIEDLGGHPCVICPWHSYRIALDTGEGLYIGLDLAAKKECVKTKGVKQRTHPVIVRDGKVIVQVQTGGPSIESDTYATMAIANQEQPTSKPTTQTNNLRNIHSKGMGGGGSFGSGSQEDAYGHLRQERLESAVKTLSNNDVPHVQCIAKRYVNADKSVACFVFDRIAGFEPKETLKPGMWTTLELPVTLSEAQATMQMNASFTQQVVGGRLTVGPSTNTFTVQSAMSSSTKVAANQHGDTPMPDTHLKRTYTIISATSNGRNRHSQGWFTIAVKNMSSPTIPRAVRQTLYAEGCGSKWLHAKAHSGNMSGIGTITSPEIRVVESGGKFSLAMERTLIARRQGKVLVLTGGIGITPAFASISDILQDDFARASGPSLHVLHVHVDSTLASVPFLPELLTYRREMAGASFNSDPMSYNLMLYATKQMDLGATKGELSFAQSPHAMSSAATHVHSGASTSPSITRASPVEDPLLKGFGHKLLGTLRESPSLVDEHLEALRKDNLLVFGRRPTKAEVLANCNLYLGSPTDFVVFLCGPDVMINEWSTVLAEAGVSPQCILTERFDF